MATAADLSVFDGLSERDASARTLGQPEQRVDWRERVEAIRRQFPSVHFDWHDVLAGNEMGDPFPSLFADILKADAAPPGRTTPGPRPGVDYSTGMARIRRFADADYAIEPFHLALAAVVQYQPRSRIGRDGRRRGGGGTTPAGALSLTSLARKSGISRSRLHRLLDAQDDPTGVEIEAVARALDKHPSFFAEYRVAFVLAAIHQRLAPESSIGFYQRCRKAAKGTT